MRYFLPSTYYAIPDPTLEQATGCVSMNRLEHIIQENFPFPVMSKYCSDVREWLYERWDGYIQLIRICPNSFEPQATDVDTDSRWCFIRDGIYGFKNKDDALLFKLTWGGT